MQDLSLRQITDFAASLIRGRQELDAFSGKSVSINTIDRLCTLLDCSVENVIEYIKPDKA